MVKQARNPSLKKFGRFLISTECNIIKESYQLVFDYGSMIWRLT